MSMTHVRPPGRPRLQLLPSSCAVSASHPELGTPRAASASWTSPRHDVRRAHLRGRRRHGRRPAGHRGQPHQQPHDGEGAPGRPPQRCRHRRRRRPGHGDGQALPAATGALREGRGHPAQPGGQGQPAQHDGPGQPPRGHAGDGRRADLRRFDERRGQGRLFSYDVTGGRYEEKEQVATGSGSLHAGTVIKVGLPAGDDAGRRRRAVRQGAVGGGRRRFRHRRSRSAAGRLSRRWPRSPPPATSGCRTTSCGRASRPSPRRSGRDPAEAGAGSPT